MQALAQFDFLFVEAEVIVLAGELNRFLVRRESLDDDLAFDVATTRTAGNLHKELEGAFAGAKVGHVEGHVGVDDADERDVGEVQTFGDHLRADEDIDLAHAKVAENFAVE